MCCDPSREGASGVPRPPGAALVQRRYFEASIERPGLRHRPPKQTRHAFATMRPMAGASPAWVARQLGHASSRMLFGVCAKWIEGADKGLERGKVEAWIGPQNGVRRHATKQAAVTRYTRDGRPAAAIDILDLLRIDAGQRTVAELVGERALAAAEIARLRAQIVSLAPDALGAPAAGPGAKERPRAAGVTAAHPQRRAASHGDRTFSPEALVRLKDVARLVGLSRSTIYKRVSDGSFPRPLRVSERSVRWRMQDLLEWVAGLAES